MKRIRRPDPKLNLAEALWKETTRLWPDTATSEQDKHSFMAGVRSALAIVDRCITQNDPTWPLATLVQNILDDTMNYFDDQICDMHPAHERAQ